METNDSLKINQTIINNTNPCYIIAELSANHNQDFDIAVNTIKAMKDAGANAVKIQTYLPESITLDSDKPWFRTREDSPWAGQKLINVYKKGFTPWEWHIKLQKAANDIGLDFFSSPFDIESIDKLETLDVPAYKIASLEITDFPLIKRAAQTGKPIIISTGAASYKDIEFALNICVQEGNENVALLKCTSAYPTPFEEVNLSLIPVMKRMFHKVIGLSDHTLGTTVPIAAVALGAKIVEKHFILDKTINGLDKQFSLTADEFKQMVTAIRDTEKAMGNGTFEITEGMKSARKFVRSLFAIQDIKKGELLTKNNIKSLRPALGLHPKHYYDILGKKAKKQIEKGTPLSFDLIT